MKVPLFNQGMKKLYFLLPVFILFFSLIAKSQTLTYGVANVKVDQRIDSIKPKITGGTFSGKSSPRVFRNIHSGGWGSKNGAPNETEFKHISELKIDKSGNLFVADYQTNLIRKISPNGVSTTFAGNGKDGNDNKGLLNSALGNINQLVLDPRNNDVYVGSTYYTYVNHQNYDWAGIKKINPNASYNLLSILFGRTPITN